MPTKRVLIPAVLGLIAVLALGACGGGGGSGGQPNARNIPTATAPAVLPEPTILSGGLLVTDGGDGDTYVVKPGDTLMAIADELGVSVEELIALNDLTDPSRLEVGQVLRIPARGGIEPTPGPDEEPPIDEEPTTEEEPAVPIGADEYEVQSGDNAAEIAARFGVTLQELADANNTSIDELRTLFVGQILTIPQFPDRTPVPTSTPEPEPVIEEPTEMPTEEPIEEPPAETPQPVEPTPAVETPIPAE